MSHRRLGAPGGRRPASRSVGAASERQHRVTVELRLGTSLTIKMCRPDPDHCPRRDEGEEQTVKTQDDMKLSTQSHPSRCRVMGIVLARCRGATLVPLRRAQGGARARRRPWSPGTACASGRLPGDRSSSVGRRPASLCFSAPNSPHVALSALPSASGRRSEAGPVVPQFEGNMKW